MKSIVPCTNDTRAVRFEKVEIFEFPFTIGDSPSVTCGAPLAMAPYHQSRHIFTFQEYEEAKMTIPRRTKRQMAMGAELRTRILLNSGHSLSKIVEAAAASDEARKLRHQSAASIATLISLHEARTMARRKLQSLVGKSTRRRSFSTFNMPYAATKVDKVK